MEFLLTYRLTYSNSKGNFIDVQPIDAANTENNQKSQNNHI